VFARSTLALWALAAVACTEYEFTQATEPVAVAPHVLLGIVGQPLLIDGSDSYAIGSGNETLPGAIERYEWTLIEAPKDLPVSLDFDAASPTATLSADAPGTFRLRLDVTDHFGVRSQNLSITTVYMRVWSDLEFRLSWDSEDTDLDLHLLREDGDYWSADDCFFANPAPDWGLAGQPSDDPVLFGDVDDGSAPETVVLLEPAETSYRLLVHYYSGHGNDRPSYDARLLVRALDQDMTTLGPVSFDTPGQVWIAGTLDLGLGLVHADGTMTTHEALGGPPYNVDEEP
jgi:hypothetical protein